jgi:hypothetical protein
MPTLLPPERIERAARIYATAKQAASAMGISVAHFRRHSHPPAAPARATGGGLTWN